MTEHVYGAHPARKIPEATFTYLTHPSLSPLWVRVRTRVERNGLKAVGTVEVVLDEVGAEMLSGLVGKRFDLVARVRLDELDSALRRSAAAAGLISVLSSLHGQLIDQKAVRAAQAESRQGMHAMLDGALADAGLSDQEWVPRFVEGVSLAGLLSKAGDHAAAAIGHAGAALKELAGTGGVFAAVGEFHDPAETGSTRRPGSDAAGGWGLAELAARCTGNAHGLDPGRLASALVLRAASAALGLPPPESANSVRDLWNRLGVTPDEVSGTVLVWGLRPPGTDAWSQMMRSRSDLGLVTHVTLHEIRAVGTSTKWADEQAQISVCENPQVLQAAARAGSRRPLLCTSGNPAGAGWLLLRRLVDHQVAVRYHGDFDWPGVAIAARIISIGAQPWRMSAVDYEAAVAEAIGAERILLTGNPAATPWDPRLMTAMSGLGVAVHEEALLDILLGDL